MSEMTDSTKRDAFRVSDLSDEMAEKAREIWLAGLGALSAVEDEGTKLFNTLVSRGESYEETRQRQLSEALNQASEKPKELMAAAQTLATRPMAMAGTMQAAMLERIEEALERTLDRVGVPTRREVQELTTLVETLTNKVDALAGTLEAQEAAATTARTAYHVVPREEGWAVEQEGADRAVKRHGTKAEAVEHGRTLASEHAPSQLTVHRKDGTIQDTFTYDD